MTKQEKIREGAFKIVEGRDLYDDERTYEAVDDILKYHHDNDVVIKVEEIRELAVAASQPETFSAIGKDSVLISTERTNHVFKWFKENNYVAVKPLVKVKK